MYLKSYLEELENLILKYRKILEKAGTSIVKDESGTYLEIANYKIQIPLFGIALRDGSVLSRSEEQVDDNSEPDWEVEDRATIICKMKENDPGKYLYWDVFDNDYCDIVSDYLSRKKYRKSKLEIVECFIDLSEFSTESEAAVLIEKCQKEWEDEPIESEEIYDNSRNPIVFFWDVYLRDDVIAMYRTWDCFYTRRERKILEIIVDEKSIDDLPFEPVEADIKFYNEHKKEYELMKEIDPNKECYFDFLSSSGT